MVSVLMMSAKMATLGLLKIKAFWNKGYDVIISSHVCPKKVLSRNSNYILDVVMWPKFGRNSISIREVILTSIFIRIWPEKPLFMRGGLVEVQ